MDRRENLGIGLYDIKVNVIESFCYFLYVLRLEFYSEYYRI